MAWLWRGVHGPVCKFLQWLGVLCLHCVHRPVYCFLPWFGVSPLGGAVGWVGGVPDGVGLAGLRVGGVYFLCLVGRGVPRMGGRLSVSQMTIGTPIILFLTNGFQIIPLKLSVFLLVALIKLTSK